MAFFLVSASILIEKMGHDDDNILLLLLSRLEVAEMGLCSLSVNDVAHYELLCDTTKMVSRFP